MDLPESVGASSLALQSHMSGPVQMSKSEGESALLERTRELYRNRPASLKPSKIAKATGIPVNWLKDFGWCRSPNPGVINVEKLYVYLSGKSLNLGA